MALTVEQLVAEPGLGLRLVAGHAGAGAIISWAHTSELLDPTPWLGGGELLMTLGLGLPEDDAGQAAYVRRLHAAGVAALAFDTGLVHSGAPTGVLRGGDDTGLAVLEVASSTPFIAISRRVIEEVTAAQVRGVQRLSAAQERFTEAALAAGVQGVVEALAATLGVSVLRVDSRGGARECAGPDCADLAGRVGAMPRGATPGSFTRADDHGYLTVQALMTRSRRHGSLVVASDAPLDSHARLLVAHALTLVAILLDRPTRLHEAEARLRRGVFRSLLRQGSGADAGLLRFFGFDTLTPVGVVVLTEVGPVREAEVRLSTLLTDAGAPFLATTIRGGVAVLLHAERLTEHAADLRGQVRAAGYPRACVGVGNPVEVFAAVDSFRQALAAARVAGAGGRRLVAFADLGVFDLLLTTQPRDTLEAVSTAVLAPLLSREDSPSDLLRTLSEFLLHNGHWEATATALGIHRHTLRKRIDRVGVLLGKDMTTAHDRAEVWIALKAREVLAMTSGHARAPGGAGAAGLAALPLDG